MENIDIDLQEIDIQNVDSVLTGPQGPTGATGSQGVQGIQGPQGEPGKDGLSPTVIIGTTTTLPPDTPATVTNSGTSTDVVLNFGIPQGSNANCLSVPTIVEELPSVGDPKTFYFVPKYDNLTTLTGDSFSINIANDGGRIKELTINGCLEQTTYSGKNKFEAVASAGQSYRASYTKVDVNSFTITSTETTNGTAYVRLDYTLEPSQTYTISWKKEVVSGFPTSVAGNLAPQIGTSGTIPSPAQSPLTITTNSSGVLRLFFYLGLSGSGTTTLGDSVRVYDVQIEEGSSDTSYEPYVGGQPSPSVYYPQPITVMSGESTVTVNSDTYTLDLGDITLAKVNTTMDYIYSEGSLWKVHKAIGKIDSYNGETITTDYVSTTGSLTTGAEVYYVLETPVEVTIEDEDLTDTLNQIISSPLPTGSNTMSITNTDVTPDLTISYYDYEENNQYRKYVYIIDSSNFEEI